MPKSPLSRELTVPTGCIEPFGGASSNIPAGFLLCDGSLVSRTQYAKLFEEIGTAWGQGDGATTFNLPDLRGRFLRGVDAGAGRDPNAGSRTASNAGGNTGDAEGSVQAQSNQSHTHSYESAASATQTNIGYAQNSNAGNRMTPLSGTQISARVTNSSGGESRPVNANVNYIIKT